MSRASIEGSQASDRSEGGAKPLESVTLGRNERTDLRVADAVQQARIEVGRHKNPTVRGRKVQGRLGELLAHEARPNSIDVNEHLPNHPVYDLYDRNHAYSVKTRLNGKDGSVPVGNYAHDLRVATGAIPPAERGRYAGMQGVDITAERLTALKTKRPEVWHQLRKRLPSEMVQTKDASHMASVMKDKAQLLVPADHVSPTREYIERVAQLHPENYGLPSNLTFNQRAAAARDLAVRVKPIAKDVTSETIENYVDKAVKPHRRYS